MKRNGIIIAALVAMAGLIGALAWLNAPKGAAVTSGDMAVTHNGETLRVYTMEDIMAMPYIEVQKEIVSSSHGNESGLFRGIPLRALLNEVDENLLINAQQIISHAEDAFVSAFSSEEVAESDSIVVVYAKDGQGLGAMGDGGSGPLRLIIQDDPFGNRSTKYLTQIEVK
jgi:DMSO/TMAO reductase YedYZ molybdopterin-dependent catalytic subunit